jgi:hypothetical protein
MQSEGVFLIDSHPVLKLFDGYRIGRRRRAVNCGTSRGKGSTGHSLMRGNHQYDIDVVRSAIVISD